jgi:hypothetical protein
MAFAVEIRSLSVKPLLKGLCPSRAAWYDANPCRIVGTWLASSEAVAMNPGLTWVSGWCSSSVDALVSAKGQSQLRRSFVGELEIADEWFGDETLEELFGEGIVASVRKGGVISVGFC